jgi:hypothetical protein
MVQITSTQFEVKRQGENKPNENRKIDEGTKIGR